MVIFTPPSLGSLFFFFNDTATTEIYTLSLHDALPIYDARPEPHGARRRQPRRADRRARRTAARAPRSEEHTSELQSHLNLVCRLLLEKKKTQRERTVIVAVSVRPYLRAHRDAGPTCT